MTQFHWPPWQAVVLSLAVGTLGCASKQAESPVQTGGTDAGASGGGAGAGSGGGGGVGTDVAVGTGAACGESAAPPAEETIPSSFRWCSTGPLVAPIPNADHPILSVKDPSVVYHGDRWHLFATTADSNGQWSLVYLSFADWKDAPAAKMYYLSDNPALTGYHAAPQVFFFAPHNKWYLIFQSGQPQYTTTDDLSQPESWVRPTNFFAGVPAIVNKSAGGWLDFWVICDEALCHLFFNDDAGQFYRSQTKIEDFPSGFAEPVIAIQGTKETVFEGGAVYRIDGSSNQYLALIEAFGPSGNRFYRSFTADTLAGEWTPLTGTWENPMAATTNVTFAGAAWTRDISHGELLRSGFDQNLTVSLSNLRFLYQGVSKGTPEYYQLPYRLGLLTRTY